MNINQAEGKIDKAVGRVQEKVGELVDDRGHRLEGAARQAQGAAKDLYGQAYEHVHDAADSLVERIERNPFAALAIAGAIGYVVGVMCRSTRD